MRKVCFEMSEKIYVDRAEEGNLVCVDENCRVFTIKRNEVDGDVEEGSVLKKHKGKFTIDHKATKSSRSKMNHLQNEVFSQRDSDHKKNK